MSRIYFICPDAPQAQGGTKKIYNSVEILRELGFEAYVLHNRYGFQLKWFPHSAPIAWAGKRLRFPFSKTSYLPDTLEKIHTEKESWKPAQDDLFILPEFEAERLAAVINPFKYAIYNQNVYFTFLKSSVPLSRYRLSGLESPYLNQRCKGCLAVSQDNLNYLKFLYPGLQLFLLTNSVSKLFHYSEEKEKRIAYMPRKEKGHMREVIGGLRARGSLHGWEFYPLDNLDEQGIASELKACAIFLNFVHLEGFCLPPAEALISGCYVIGYDGRAAAEFMKEPYAQVIAYGDFQNFILKTEQAAELFENNPRAFLEITKKGSEEIRMSYTREKEKEGLLKAFDKLLSQV